ncbi:MAG: DUF992 domain-containing protein [Rhodomicrobium sp.]
MGSSFFRTLAAVAAALVMISLSPAVAQERIEVGQLTCGVKGGVSFIIGSTKELRCLFRVSPNDPGERYEGEIRKYGLDIGITNNAFLAWTVFAPSRGVEGGGALAGKYVGVAADASVGLGGGANALVGGSNNTFSLQPLSVQGQTGLNAAVTVAEVELHPYYDDLK